MTERRPSSEAKVLVRTYSAWSRDMFADALVVPAAGRLLFLAGVGAEIGEAEVDIAFPDDFAGQCRLVYQKIGGRLRAEGASFHHIVRIVGYVTDMRHLGTYFDIQGEALDGAPRPPHTMLGVNQLADPRMLVEVEVTALVP